MRGMGRFLLDISSEQGAVAYGRPSSLMSASRHAGLGASCPTFR